MEDNGVKVIRWRNTDEPYQGQHRKLLIVDDEAAIAGGLNPGNCYSHPCQWGNNAGFSMDRKRHGHIRRNELNLFICPCRRQHGQMCPDIKHYLCDREPCRFEYPDYNCSAGNNIVIYRNP